MTNPIEFVAQIFGTAAIAGFGALMLWALSCAKRYRQYGPRIFGAAAVNMFAVAILRVLGHIGFFSLDRVRTGVGVTAIAFIIVALWGIHKDK